MSFWIIFAFLGLMGVPIIIVVLTMMETIKQKICGTLVVLAFWFVWAGAMYGMGEENANRWNNGYCECGQHWELKGVTRTKMGSEIKYYACPSCYEEIEINH